MIRFAELRRDRPLHTYCEIVLSCRDESCVDCSCARGHCGEVEIQHIDRRSFARRRFLIRITPGRRQSSRNTRRVWRHDGWRRSKQGEGGSTWLRAAAPAPPSWLLVGTKTIADQ